MKLIEVMKRMELVPLFHLKNNEPQRVIEIPEDIWNSYLEKRTSYLEVARQLNSFFTEFKDKPMHVAKNHINEGEVHKFNDDGSIEVYSK